MLPIRVLYVIGGGEFGGAEQHLLGLCKALPKERLSPHIAVFYNDEFARRAREAGLPVTFLTPSGLGGRYGMNALIGLIQTFDPQIIHTHGVRANVLGRLAKKSANSRAKMVTTIHSVLSLDYTNPLRRWIFANLEKATRGQVDQFILVSRAMREAFVAQGYPEDKLRVIHNAIELPGDTARNAAGLDTAKVGHAQAGTSEAFSEAAAEGTAMSREMVRPLCRELDLPDDAILIGTVARLHAVKGHTYILEAAKTLCAHHSNVHFVWVGGGDLRSELAEQIKVLGLEDHVHMLGFRRDVGALLDQFDIFVLASLSEGLSVALLEAMAHAVPVVATRVGGNPEVVRDGETGILVPAEDGVALAVALDELAGHRDRARSMGEAAREDVEQRFSQQRLVREVLELYEHLLHI